MEFLKNWMQREYKYKFGCWRLGEQHYGPTWYDDLSTRGSMYANHASLYHSAHVYKKYHRNLNKNYHWNLNLNEKFN